MGLKSIEISYFLKELGSSFRFTKNQNIVHNSLNPFAFIAEIPPKQLQHQNTVLDQVELNQNPVFWIL